ncbi:hypothetical protein RhiirA5_472660 [Rhizophagus irregularis]|uniref:Uncharacterized protein n=4 Tax=Rhizophagus irregularis TaxID=588596 RepID=U9TPA5_RHIID|nr:hypothetical protein GLOIN_2v1574900 [Rhizophagus irregularis DAOM 181602=DAOM 197198]ANQ33021.1 MATA-HMG [Rhizophagus irregularis]EXX55059.1 hypothetical protein RirG_228780 [Rhizophagus irregularis DAOM 197198w]ANQ33023.1 MATA-HMG [Rhizophagus irregularis]ANQ33024.1 MATA-HMG [Rhizophagus irregularis]ANQ33025.1 MATA-HMG [Rhizophagus irregularis]|eukprot:XP_025181420.1 hypothetical protein GLOIN_2v1574900 [Rhizophagus irregularis DAOM 181602=DAOM 197198]
METFDDYNNNSDDKPFEDPLQNPYFRYYLEYINNSYDFIKLQNDVTYLQNAYNDYFDKLIEYCRPNYPPYINVEEYTLSFDEIIKNKRRVKDITKKNAGNSFMLYRKYLYKYLETSGINIPMQSLSSLAGHLWASEPKFVKDYYKKLSDQIKNLHNERLKDLIQSIPNKRKQPSDDDQFELLYAKFQRLSE